MIVPGASNPTEVARSCSAGRGLLGWMGLFHRALLAPAGEVTAVLPPVPAQPSGAVLQAGRGCSSQAPCAHGERQRHPLGIVRLGSVTSLPGELSWIWSCQAGGICLGRESLIPISSSLKSAVLKYLRLHGVQQEIGGMESAFPPLFPRKFSFAPFEHF